MSADNILAHLDRVKSSGPDNWVARCPAHTDKSPSLAIRELADGTVLLHCFAGCGVEQVLTSIGMTFDDLYPPKPIGDTQAQRVSFPPLSILQCIAKEALVVSIVASHLAEGNPLSPADMQSCLNAARRITDSLEMIR